MVSMFGTFSGASSFASDIRKWDVSRVTTLRWFMLEAASFTQDLETKGFTENHKPFHGKARETRQEQVKQT